MPGEKLHELADSQKRYFDKQLSMNNIVTAIWGAFFCIVVQVFVTAVYAHFRGVRKVARNAAIFSFCTGLFVAVFLGWLPVDLRMHQRILGIVQGLVSLLMLYLLVRMLGILRQRDLIIYLRRVLGVFAAVVLVVGAQIEAYDVLLMGSVIAVGLCVTAVALVVYVRLRGDGRTGMAFLVMSLLLVTTTGQSWIALSGWNAGWQLQALVALASTGCIGVFSVAIWARYSYLLELRRVVSYGPSYDPVTRMRTRTETGDMVGSAFYLQEKKGDTGRNGVIVVTISNLYSLEKLHGSAALNHALYICATRIRQIVPSHVETGRLGKDGFLLLVRNLKEPQAFIQLTRELASRLARPVSLRLHSDAVPGESELLIWQADFGVGLLLATQRSIKAYPAVKVARSLSRSALALPGRIAWYSWLADEVTELPAAGD